MSTDTTRDGLPLLVNSVTGRARLRSERDADRQGRERTSPYRSKWEHTFATYLDELLSMRTITWWAYEPITLRLAPSLRYVPDFWAQHCQPEGLTVYEVKGWSRNRREGIAKLKMAAVLYPWARFVLVEYRGSRMQCTLIPAGGHHAEDTTSESPTTSDR